MIKVGVWALPILLMGDWRLIVYGALLWLFFHVFVVAYEEPTLERTFGSEYEAFRAAERAIVFHRRATEQVDDRFGKVA